MAKQLLTLEEVIAMLQTTAAPNRVIDAFRAQAEQVFVHNTPRQVTDDVQVGSGYGHATHKGLVELTINTTRTQMETKKAREIGLMLLAAAEAAESDEMVMRLLTRLGFDDDDHQRRGAILLELREIRQGSRGVVYPT